MSKPPRPTRPRKSRLPRPLTVEVREDPTAPPSQLIKVLASLLLSRAYAKLATPRDEPEGR